jgi:hypothetical protein
MGHFGVTEIEDDYTVMGATGTTAAMRLAKQLIKKQKTFSAWCDHGQWTFEVEEENERKQLIGRWADA